MKRITSIKNAIKYFEEGSTKKVSKSSSGKEYTSIIPPMGFRRMLISEYFYDTRGRIAGTITQRFHSFQWLDYPKIIQDRKDKIVKLIVYCEK